jgi:RNA recognition motif-containing protein
VNGSGEKKQGVWLNIFVGNLSYTTTEDSLRRLFEQYGEVTSVRIINDRETGRSRGFGFVEMANDDEARAAIAATNAKAIDGRTINVNQARPREERAPRRDRW